MRRTASLLLISLVVVLPVGAVGGCTAAPALPEILSLESRDRVVAPGDSVLIECVAVAADGGDLAYEWSSDRGTLQGHAGMYAWTAPEQEGVARITVTVSNRAGDTVSETIAIVVKRNTPPVIKGLTSDRDWVSPGETANLYCAAEDLDGDPLTYSWSADCGQLSGEGTAVSWTAPLDEGECTIEVLVDDGYGGQVDASISIVVSLDEPLLVTDMVVTAADDPLNLVLDGGRYTIYQGEAMLIRAVVNNPDRVTSYEWTDGGPVALFPVGSGRITFEGGPAEIRWAAPGERGDHVITVTVKGDGAQIAKRSILVTVETCRPCM